MLSPALELVVILPSVVFAIPIRHKIGVLSLCVARVDTTLAIPRYIATTACIGRIQDTFMEEIGIRHNTLYSPEYRATKVGITITNA